MSIVVVTNSDRFTALLRKFQPPHVDLVFIEDVEDCATLRSRHVALVLLHLPGARPAFALGGRLLRQSPELRCPLVGIVDGATSLVRVPLYDAVLSLSDPWWSLLIRRLIEVPANGIVRLKLAALLQSVVPALSINDAEYLLHDAASSLSVKRWSSFTGRTRTTIYRHLSTRQLVPRRVVEVAFIASVLAHHITSPGQTQLARVRRTPTRRERLLLHRTLGMSFGELADTCAEERSSAFELVLQRLREHVGAVRCAVRSDGSTRSRSLSR